MGWLISSLNTDLYSTAVNVLLALKRLISLLLSDRISIINLLVIVPIRRSVFQHAGASGNAESLCSYQPGGYARIAAASGSHSVY